MVNFIVHRAGRLIIRS